MPLSVAVYHDSWLELAAGHIAAVYQPPTAAPLSAIPFPLRLPVQTNSRRQRPSGAGAILTAQALSATRGGRGLANRRDTRPMRKKYFKPNLPFIEEIVYMLLFFRSYGEVD